MRSRHSTPLGYQATYARPLDHGAAIAEGAERGRGAVVPAHEAGAGGSAVRRPSSTSGISVSRGVPKFDPARLEVLCPPPPPCAHIFVAIEEITTRYNQSCVPCQDMFPASKILVFVSLLKAAAAFKREDGSERLQNLTQIRQSGAYCATHHQIRLICSRILASLRPIDESWKASMATPIPRL